MIDGHMSFHVVTALGSKLTVLAFGFVIVLLSLVSLLCTKTVESFAFAPGYTTPEFFAGIRDTLSARRLLVFRCHFQLWTGESSDALMTRGLVDE